MNTHEELFESYLKGRSTTAERADFEARMRADPSFAEQFRQFRAAAAVVRIAGDQRLKQRLAAIHAEVFPERRGRLIPITRRGWLAIAASVLVLIGVSYFFASRQASTSDLYAEHMVAYPGPDRERSDDGANDPAWTHFADAYSEERYDDAITGLDTMTSDAAPAYMVAFYRGQCLLLKTNPDPQAAMRAFQEVLATDNDLLASARWYLGLAAMNHGDHALARVQFTALRDAGAYKHTEAARLLEALPDEQ
ncbi:MAG: hypothetical protein IPM12_00645 [Flavobacteriales bacterium]|nr:hypothetical protein [Flavobacteriales bacterium]